MATAPKITTLTPAPAPVAEEVETAPAPDSIPVVDDDDAQDQDDMNLIDEIFGLDEEVGETPAAEESEETPEAGETEVVTEEAGAETPAAEVPAEETPATPETPTEAVSTETAETAPAAEAEAVSPDTMQVYEQQLQQFNEQAVDLLATEVYALNDEQVADLETDLGANLPRVAANLHMQVMRATTMNIARLLPSLMENIQSKQAQTTAFEDQFFTANPELKDHRADVLRYGQVYRANNPNASDEAFTKEVGLMVRMSLGLQQATAEAAVAPAAVPVTPPHKPAGAGPSGAPRAAAPTNEFELLSQEEID